MGHSQHPFSGGSAESVKAGHELTDVKVGPLLQFGVMLAVIVVVTMWAMLKMHNGFDEYFTRTDEPVHPMSTPTVPAGPRLQANEAAEYRVYAEAQRAATATDGAYRWIDKSGDVVAVPISRAMELVLQQGLPHRPPNK